MKAIATLPLVFGVVLLGIVVLYALYSPQPSFVAPMAVTYETTHSSIEVLETSKEAVKDAVALYFAASLVFPDLVAKDLASDAKVLKETIYFVLDIYFKEQEATYGQSKVAKTCFCSPFVSEQFRESVTNTAKEDSIYLPLGALHLGSCAPFVGVYVMGVRGSSFNISLSFSEGGWRFACISEEDGYSRISLVKPTMSVSILDAASLNPPQLGIDVAGALEENYK